jgi:NADPH-dependent glutamate synthase beta subunit-like oxidoreductase
MTAPVTSTVAKPVANPLAALVPTTWTTGSTAVIKTGTWRAALARHIKAPAPCHGACPVSGDIAEWIALARARDFKASWQVLTRHNPFPSIAGRICHHPCEAACNRAGFDEALSICKLERFVGDQALKNGWAFESTATAQTGHVAIVGGGPSGLSAAYHLRRLGYAVTLYEAQAQLGGLMRYGIPAYRLSREVLDGEIARIVAMGVTVRCNHRIEGADGLERLREQHDALYLALGAERNKRLPTLDYSQSWVCDGAAYLAAANAGKPLALGHRLVVIGGGSAALDAARSARRLGHEVTLLALEQRAQMPAQAQEVAEALEEGITVVDGARLDAAIDGTAKGLTLTCTRVAFVPGAERGQFTLTPAAGSSFTLNADAIITSIGQDPDLSVLGAGFAAVGGLLQIDAQMGTSSVGIYAGGDMTSMARFVTEAIGMGQRAAQAIARALAQRDVGACDVTTPHYDDEPLVPLAAISTFYHPKREREQTKLLDAQERLQREAEVQLGLELEQALAESERCFSCGTCIHCDNCVVYCPDMAVKRLGDGYIVLGDYCKGCGVCVKECPTGSMKMQEEFR